MVLEPIVRDRLERVIREVRAQDRILAHGLQPRRKVLLIGPPTVATQELLRSLDERRVAVGPE
jgi:hypothetical protein